MDRSSKAPFRTFDRSIMADSTSTDAHQKIIASAVQECEIIDDNSISIATVTSPNIIPNGDDNMNLEETNRNSVTVDNTSNSNNISSRNRLISNERASISDENHVQLIAYPRINCTENIIFCIDASSEMDKTSFRSRAGDKLSPRQLTKRGLNMFLQSKQRIDRKHQYALILLEESASWIQEFTNNPKDIQLALDDVHSHFCETCDLASVFDQIVSKVELPTVDGDQSIFPPQHTIRLILIYARSNCPLQISNKESFNLLNSCPYFFLDALYLHEPPGDDNQCQAVFDTICDLDHKGLSYIMGATKNPTKVYDAMAQFLAHPLQRTAQSDAAYKLELDSPLTENG